jgi:hypothetical protein
MGQEGGFVGHVLKHRSAPGRLVYGLADVAVEIAIGAFRNAERPMNVEGERSILPKQRLCELGVSVHGLSRCDSDIGRSALA